MFALIFALQFAVIEDSMSLGSFRYDHNDDDAVHQPAPDSNCEQLKTAPSDGLKADAVDKFCKCSTEYGINSIVLTEKTIANYAFYKCEAIKSVKLPDDLTTIGVGAFALCPYLETIENFPTTLQEISDGAFYFASSLKSIPGTIPATVSSIGCIAFAECQRLSSVTLNIATRQAQSDGEILTLTFKDSSFYKTNVKLPASFPTFVNVETNAFKYCDQGDTVRTLNFHGGLIGNYAFAYCNNLNVVLSEDTSIKSIGDGAFRDTATSWSPNFPTDIRTIPKFAYYNTKISGKIDCKNVRSIGESAFAFTTFDELIIDSVTSIGQNAFQGCTINGPITFSYNFKTISQSAFQGAHLEDLSINGATISGNAFEEATMNSVEITDSYILGEAFKKAKIGSSLTIIDTQYKSTSSPTVSASAFNDCEIRTSINLSDVRKIDDLGFYGLSRKYSPVLTFYHDPRFTLNEGSLSIGASAFHDTTIILENPKFDNTYSSIGNSAFSDCHGVSGDLYLNAKAISDRAFYHCNLRGKLELGEDCGELPDPSDVFTGCHFTSFNISLYEHDIPERLFSGMTNLVGDLTISDKVTSIGKEAFLGCGLTSINIEVNPNAALEIKEGAFYKCRNMQCDNLTLLRNIQQISEYAFYQCQGIKGVTFSPTVTNIKEYAFAQTGLTRLELPRLLQEIGDNAFMSCTSLTQSLDIPDGAAIGDYAFYDCPFTGGTLTTGYNLASISPYAFYRCKFSGNLRLPRISSIGQYAFYECSNLQSIELYEPYSTTSSQSYTIGEAAFQGCTGLTGSLPIKWCRQIDRNAFYGCSGLTGGLDFYETTSSSLTTISDYAFYQCSGLNGELHFPKGLQHIYQYAFYGCTELIGPLDFPDTLEDIGDYAFTNCHNLNGPLIFRASDTSHIAAISEIGDHAFEGCSNINGSLNIGNANTIGSYAFAGCSGLTGPLSFNTDLQRIGSFAFQGCSGFSDSLSLNIGPTTNPTSPNGLLYIERGAFKDCTGFKDGLLIIDIREVERNNNYVYKFYQFLKIGNEAFENCKFKNIYYNGRFEPDCDLDIGISGNKGIKTSSHYANKTFCSNPLHHNKLSGGAIAGIVIACVVVVAIIVAVIVYLILRNKKNKDNSEAEVEMNQDP